MTLRQLLESVISMRTYNGLTKRAFVNLYHNSPRPTSPESMATICQACGREILENESWHYVWKPGPGRLEPVHDRCAPSQTGEEKQEVGSGSGMRFLA